MALQIREALRIGLPFLGSTQATHGAGRIDHEEVFERLAFLLAAVVVFLALGIGWTVDWSFSTIMPNRGALGPPPSVGLRTSPPMRQRCELEANPDGLRLDSTRDEGGESTSSHAIAPSQRADLALLESESVSQTSA
jgi:hypothetical protein